MENFEKLIKGGYYYVDKSLLIKDILTLSGEIKLITRPRRFGKTLAMDMMKSFFSVDEKEDLFAGLKIKNEKKIIKEHYHRYPVIYVSFKSVKESTWERAYDSFKNLLAKLAKDAKKYAKDDHDKIYLEKIINKQATKSEYESFLWSISKMAYEKTGVMPIILIDEYDVPIESAYVNRHKDPDYYDNMIDFMRAFLTFALKGSDTYFSFAILTGVYRIAKESIFSGLNNLVIYSIFDQRLSDKYGFTEDEIVEMIEYYNLTDEDKKMIDGWYGNYRIGNMENLYNPWSVVNYIATRIETSLPPEEAVDTYWINTSSNDIIISQLENNERVKEKLDKLIEGKDVVENLNPNLSLREIDRAKSGVWVLFANAGYLAAKRLSRREYSLKIPNEEILEFFKDSVQMWIERKDGYSPSEMYTSLKEMLTRGKYENFKKQLKEFILTGFSFFDVAKDESERFYKGFLLGLLSVAINGFKVESEMESGYGRLDVVVYPRDKRYGQYAAIFEVKKADNESRLEVKAKEALKQIKERKYYAKMKSLGYEVIGFGIAFCRKKVEIKTQAL